MKNKKMLIIIIAVVVLLAVAAGLYFFVFSKKDEETEPEIIPSYYPLEDAFVTNVKDSGKLFKTTVILIADSPDLAELMTENQYLVRDEILFILRSLTEQDIASQTIQERLREQIPARLNEALGIENFYSVMFSDFVMQ